MTGILGVKSPAPATSRFGLKNWLSEEMNIPGILIGAAAGLQIIPQSFVPEREDNLKRIVRGRPAYKGLHPERLSFGDFIDKDELWTPAKHFKYFAAEELVSREIGMAEAAIV